jgi:hypothetical protein
MSSENSQHLSDWYSPSHIIHGFIFYGVLWLISRWVPMSFGTRLILAVAIEASWEVIENTDWLINAIAADRGARLLRRQRHQLGGRYAVYDRWLLPRALVAGLAHRCRRVALELIVGYMIRDNLTLNVLMLLWPVQSSRWQAGR